MFSKKSYTYVAKSIMLLLCFKFNFVFASIMNSNKQYISYASKKLIYLPTIQFKSAISPAKSIIFLHMPKVGGTNLRFVAEALSKSNESFKARRFIVPRVRGRSAIKIYENWTGALESVYEALEKDPDLFKGMKFISGHFPFGLHILFDNEAKYIVLIRNPIEREISSTNYDFQRGFVGKEQVKEYLMTANIDNPQTRILAGIEYMNGECNEDVLALAKSNIEKYFLLSGVTEDTNSFIQALASIQGWGPLALNRSQVSGEKVLMNVAPEFSKILAEKHKFDLQLYEWVKNRWFAWKEKNIDYASINLLSHEDNKKTLCILPEFASTRMPEFMSIREIEEYNKNKSDELVQVVVQIDQHCIGARPADIQKK